jgi:LacI family transcriptional regulator
VDNYAGGYEAGSYLLQFGHRHVGVIASEGDQHVDVLEPGTLRLLGIHAAFKDAGVENSLQFHIEDSASNIEVGYRSIKILLGRAPQITAVFALTDQTAVGVYHGVNDLCLSIPEDISVMGFDNIPPLLNLLSRWERLPHAFCCIISKTR